MDLYLDEKLFGSDIGGAATLADVVAAVRTSLEAESRVILRLACDGQEMGGDVEASLLQPAHAFGRIDFCSGRAEELVVDALGQALEILAATVGQRKQIVEWLARGENKPASQALIECFQAWSQIHQSIVQSLAFLRLDEHHFDVGGRPLDETMRGIPEQLLQIKEALQAGDNVLLADVLEYEFDETSDRWREAVTAILAHAQAALGRSAVIS